jgi:hypothetical protein
MKPLSSTEVLSVASSQMRINTDPSMKKLKAVRVLFPDLARLPTIAPNSSPYLPTILTEAKERVEQYGFSWFHLPYLSRESISEWDQFRRFFYSYAKAMFEFAGIDDCGRAKVKFKDWMMNVGYHGNYDFHQDDPGKRGFFTLVYGGRQNLRGGHFELRNKKENIVYRIPSLNGRFSVISFRDEGNLFHRATKREAILSKGQNFEDSHHWLLAFRGWTRTE